MKYKCLRCNDTFEEPEEARIWNPRFDTYFEGTTILGCPSCGCYHFEETKPDDM